MRRYILLFIALCLQVAARGQTIADIDLSWLPQPTQAKALRIWFDDGDSLQTTNTINGTHIVDVSSLLDGLHTIHFQVIDSEDKVAAPYSCIFLKTSQSNAATVQSFHYWFDNNAANTRTATSAGIQTLDVSTLLDGLHTIHYQVTGSDGVPAHIASGFFFKTGGSNEAGGVKASKLIYWFDDETTLQYLDVTDGVQMLDASEMIEGLHTLHYQVLCNNGQMTPAMSSMFLRLSIDTETAAAKSLRYWFDDGQEASEVEITDGVQLLDASDLLEGLHTVHYQVMGSTGMPGVPCTSVFLKIDADMTSATARSVRYWFDDDATTVKITDVANGTQTLEVADMPIGLHTLNYQLIDSNGKVGIPVTRLFMKSFETAIASDHNSIVKYQYWLNNNSATMQTVAIDEPVNPYTLIALLPMQQEPFRSSNFHFENKDGKPMMYAKNDFYVRFTDAAGYFVDDSRPFTDYSVSREVKPVGELQATQTFPKVAENDVRWYTVEAEVGDSLAFKSSQATSIQFFSPSGKELYAASGSQSVAYGGAHAWEEGTYYLAVHDVTGSQNTMKLEYMHIGKYAVLSHSPEEVGVVEGNFYIQLFGNGYDKLTKAQLWDGSNVLTASVIQTQDISNATLQFSFASDNYPRGDYDLILEFTDDGKTESITIEDAVTITEPVFGDIALEVISRPAVAKPYPVTVKVKNTGNVTYQFVPLFFANSINQMESVELLNFGIQSSKNIIDAGVKTFYKVKDFLGEDSCIVVPTIIPYLSSYQSMEFMLGFVTGPHARFNMYAWTETPWSMRDASNPQAMGTRPRKAPPVNITCEMDPCDLMSRANIPNPGCICDVLWGSISALANLEASVYQWRNDKLYEAYGEDFELLGIDWPYQRIPLKSPEDIFNQVRRGCTSELLPDELSRIHDAIEDIMDEMREHDPRSCPPPPPHPQDPYMPGDPNEIYGYTSDTGSKFVSKDMVNVYYDIEFENDSTIANAAAHHIVVSDTLDSKHFDLATFSPTGINLGNKKITLNGEQNFLKTIDLRPDFNVIAQIQLKYDEQKGVATWDILSLDPMTMEPTDDAIQGILPVNYDGTSGIGEVSFDINLRTGLADGTEIKNRAGIVFDYEEAILTPTWTNIVDAVAPSSVIDNSWMVNDSTLRVTADAFDARSGVWKYTWYVQAGENAPWWKEGETESPQFDYHIFEGIDYGFCVLATDSAGNVEQKVIQRERSFKTYGQDFEDRIDEANGQSSMVNGQSIYDLSGRRQAVPKENQVNIIDKKKVLIR